MATTKLQESGGNCTPEPKEPCRVCMKKLKTEGIPIFGDGTRPDISADLITFGSIELSRDDDLPSALCKDCVKWLKSAVLFRETAQKSDLLLKRRQKNKQNTLRKTTKPIEPKIEILGEANKTKLQIPHAKTDLTDTPTNHAFLSEIDEQIKQNISNIKNEKTDYKIEIQIGMEMEKCESESSEAVILKDSDNMKMVNTDNMHPNFPCMACALDFLSLGEYNQHLTEYHDDTFKTKSEKIKCELCENTYTSHYYKVHLKHVHKVVDRMPQQNIFFNDQVDKQGSSITNKANLTDENDRDNLKYQAVPKDGTSEDGVETRKECEVCDESFNLIEYKHHIKTKHVPQADKNTKHCEICKTNLSRENYYRHIKNHYYILRKHISSKTTLAKRKVRCIICKKSYSLMSIRHHLDRHKYQEIQEDTGRGRYICDQCGRMFLWRNSLSSHVLTHTDLLPQRCNYCPYRTRTKAALSIHLRTHSDVYKYNCMQCSARYRTKSNLNTHMRRHRAALDFMCEQCSRGFYSNLELLERHIKAVHLRIKNHICNVCGKAFGYRKQLTKHTRCVHNRDKLACGRLPLYLQMELKKKEAEQNEVLLFNVTTY